MAMQIIYHKQGHVDNVGNCTLLAIGLSIILTTSTLLKLNGQQLCPQVFFYSPYLHAPHNYLYQVLISHTHVHCTLSTTIKGYILQSRVFPYSRPLYV